MKTSHKAVLTFAITAISTLSGGTCGSITQTLLEQTYVPASSISGKELSPPNVFKSLKPKRSRTIPGADRYFPEPRKHMILPVADALSQPVCQSDSRQDLQGRERTVRSICRERYPTLRRDMHYLSKKKRRFTLPPPAIFGSHYGRAITKCLSES